MIINNMAASADDQCMQFYQQPMMDGIMVLHPSIMEGLKDATIMSSSSEGTSLSPSNSQNNTSGHKQLTPKDGAIFKPIRRRSRASKRTPTTLLKANTSNFRALVQQFTGNPTTAAMSLSIHKGPITLNFQQHKKHNIHHHTKITRPIMPTSGTISSTSNQFSVPRERQAQLVSIQEQQSGYWLEHEMKSSNFIPTWGNSYSCIDDDGFLIDNYNDFSLHELTVNNAISNDAHGLFM